MDIQLKRQDYLEDKVINNVEDEDDDADCVKGIFLPPDYLVEVTDEDPL